jgi:hypothetical protein
MPLVESKGYSPDADPSTPGIFTDCVAVVPTLKGFKAAPAAMDAGLDALPAACKGAVSAQKLDSSVRVFGGTVTGLYELSGTSWVERSEVTAGYTLGADNRWRYAQFGDVTLATAKTDRLQASSSGAFAKASAAAPKASIVEVVNNFVVVFDTDETTYGNSPDRWWCSAIGDHTDWTVAIATQCQTGRLTSSPGAIKAGRKFGDRIIAYKEKAMYVGSYVGQPNTFDFVEVAGKVGALCQEVVVDIGTAEEPRHIFMGYEDFYSFNGATPVPIGTNRVKENVFGALNRTYAAACIALHDRTKALVYFFYPTASASNPDKCVVYNYRTDKWGRDDRTIEAALEYIVPSLTYQGFGTSYATYGAAPNVTYGSSIFVSGYPAPALFNTSHKLNTLNATPTASSYTTGDIGDDNVESLLSFVKPRFITAPSSGQQTNYYKQNSGDSLTADQTIALSNGRFDVLREARWHRVLHSYDGDWESPGIWYEVERAGDE